MRPGRNRPRDEVRRRQVTLPAPVEAALELAEKLSVLEEIFEAIEHIVRGDQVKARLAAETASIKAAARAPYIATEAAKKP